MTIAARADQPRRDTHLRWIIAPAVTIGAVIIYLGLAPAASFLTYSALRLPRGSRIAAAVEFFAFEVPKVLMLLTAVVFVVGILRSYFTAEAARRLLAGRRELSGNVVAALFGVATPFCSCSAVPLFIGFVTAGVPLGVTLSFLISAPMVNEVALVLLFAMFGWKVALLYLTTGLVIATVAGWIIGRLKLERHVEAWVWNIPAGASADAARRSWRDRLADGRAAIREIVGKVWPYVIAGIAVGSAIHGYVPTDFMARFMGRDAWWAVPVAVILGVPMYANAAGVIPVVQALLGKGAALGTVLAFMMAVVGLSLPETIILRKVLRPVLIGVFVGVVAAGIVIVGYLFNAVL